jgi:hypothetical protein
MTSLSSNAKKYEGLKNKETLEPMILYLNASKNIGKWKITDDGVMGGKSKGSLLFEKDFGIFTGNISLDNNGGFSSVSRDIEQLQQGLENIIIDIRGDGQIYQLRLAIYFNGYRLAYKHDFDTKSGQRQKLSLSLSDFKASFRGRVINNAPLLQSQHIKEIGFLIATNKPTNFNLSIFSLTFS